MPFVKASKKVEFVAMGFRGPTKSGKTVTSAMEAIYIVKKYHPKGTPVAWVPTEPGLDFILDMFHKEDVPVLEPDVRSRSFDTLKASIPDAIKAGAGVYLVDNLTHFRAELVAQYKRDNKITRKLRPFEYAPINDIWNEWTTQMLVAPIDKILLGRIGNIFEEYEDEEGETETKVIGKKMKAGGETEYELDELIEMCSREDLDAPNAIKVPKLGKPDMDGNRKVAGKRLKRVFTANKLHILTVSDGRIPSLNGQSLVMKPYAEYKAGMCEQVGKFLDAYVGFVKSGTKGTQAQVVDLKPGSPIFSTNGETNGSYLRKKKAIEIWAATKQAIWPKNDAASKQQRQVVCERITGIRSQTEFERQSADELDFQVLILRKFEERAKDEGIPASQEDLGALVDLAREEAEYEWKVIHGDSQTATSEPTVGQQEPIPF